jgi:hypothetical protein
MRNVFAELPYVRHQGGAAQRPLARRQRPGLSLEGPPRAHAGPTPKAR